MRKSLCLAATSVLVMTGGGARAKGAGAKAAAQPPAALMASASRGPASSVDGLRAFADAVKPGSGAILSDDLISLALARAIDAESLAGFDRASPSYVLYVDGGGATGFALVGKVGDPEALANTLGDAASVVKNGWAVIGSRPVLDQVATWSLRALPPLPDVASPTVTVYVPQVLARYRHELEAARAEGLVAEAASKGGERARKDVAVFDGMIDVLGDTDRVTLTVTSDATEAALALAVIARPRTRLAAFFAAQRPSDHGLLDQIEGLGASVVMSGRLSAGPYRDALKVLASMNDDVDALSDFHDAVWAASTGEFAVTMDLVAGKTAMKSVSAIADRKAAAAASARLFDAIAGGVHRDSSSGSRSTIVALPAATHDGVEVRGYQEVVDLTTVPKDERDTLAALLPSGTSRTYIASFDDRVVTVSDPDDQPGAFRAIDVARGTHARDPQPPAVLDQLAASRARHDSVCVLLDLGSLAAMFAHKPGVPHDVAALSAGFADGAGHVRMSVRAPVLHAMIATP